MNIVLFTQEDPFYVNVFFKEFLSNYRNLNEIKAVVISRPMGKKSTRKLAKQMYEFYGFFNFLRVGVKYVFYKIFGKIRINKNSRYGIKQTYSVEQTVRYFDIPVIKRTDLNSKSFLEMISEFKADLFISIASPVIFKENLISMPKLDCINIHNAPLPNYRGMLPNFWQLYHNEQEVGITVHQIAKGIDTGDIIDQQYMDVNPNETLDQIIKKTKKKDAWMIIDTIEAYKNNAVKYRKMNGKGTYHSFPTKKDVIKFLKKGKKLF